MLRPARFPERENFLGGEKLHRLFHNRNRKGENAAGSALRRLNKTGFTRFLDVVIALPAFVLELDVLDRDCISVGVEIAQGLKFRNPGAKDLVAQRKLSSLVIDVDDDVLAKILERNFRAQPGTEVPDFV